MISLFFNRKNFQSKFSSRNEELKVQHLSLVFEVKSQKNLSTMKVRPENFTNKTFLSETGITLLEHQPKKTPEFYRKFKI